MEIVKGIKIQEDMSRYIADSLDGLGAIYHSLCLNGKALSYYNEALKIFRQIRNPFYLTTILDNIGFTYLDLKDYRKAKEFLLESDKWWGKMGFGTPSSSLIEFYLAVGLPKAALSLYKDMKPPAWYSSLSSRIQYYMYGGVIFLGVRKFIDSSRNFLSSVELIEERRNKISSEKGGFFISGHRGGYVLTYKGLVTALFERAFKGDKNDAAFEKYGKDLSSSAFYFSESTKARTLIEEIAVSARKYQSAELPTQIREKEQMLTAQVAKLDDKKEEAYKKGEEAFKEHQERYKKAKAEMDDLIAKLRKEYPRYAALMYPRPFKIEDLPLRDNEVLLEYEITDKAGYLFVVENGKVKRLLKISKNKEDIEALVNEFMLPLQSPEGIKKEEFSVNLGQKLYDLLIADALKDIPPDKSIIIVPDGILRLLPFEALVMKAETNYKDSLYVGDKYKISYAQSATVLALNRILKPSQAAKPLFALGNPIYDKNDPRYIAYKQGQPQPTMLAQNKEQYSYRALATRREWGKTTKGDKEGKELVYIPLPESEDEVTSIAKLFGVKPEPQDVLLGVYANETELRKVPLKDYRYLHFATHADLPGKVQGIKESFLLLGQVENKEGDDGFLTLTEVLDLKLDADLVVLSACLTGRGKVMEGEGVANFARAFQHAGARSVLVSLWEVASDATVEYMKIFYQHLKNGKSKAEALKLARNEIKQRYPNPFYWAPFILHGER